MKTDCLDQKIVCQIIFLVYLNFIFFISENSFVIENTNKKKKKTTNNLLKLFLDYF